MSNLTNNTTKLNELLETINNLPSSGGTKLPTLTNEGTAADLLNGKQLIDGDGNIVEGTIATKTSSNLTASGATVTVPAGYYATQATKSVATATQATPSVSINSSGLITASTTQSAGYVVAGTKSGTKQLTTQAAKTVTPTTSNQTAVASGRYTTGAITVKGDANLKAENIAEGVSIFGITGTHSGGSSGEDVTDETNAYTTKLSSLETAITALETELAGKASGGSNDANTSNEWVCVASLPTTYAIEKPGSTTYYYEIPENCRIMLVYMLGSSSAYDSIHYIERDPTSGAFSTLETIDGTYTDETGTGEVLKITGCWDTANTYLLSIHRPVNE